MELYTDHQFENHIGSQTAFQQPHIKLLPEVLLPWYRIHHRKLPWREDREPYHIWLSEIMLQQTRVEAVKLYYTRFLAALPTIRDLADAEEELLLKLWEGLGYYSRARNLKKAAVCIMEEYGGIFPSGYEEILRLPGIGAYTAGAVASICFEQPVPAVDGNVLRVISRIAESYENIDHPATRGSVAAALRQVYPAGHCGEFTQSLMELGALVCVPNGPPKCTDCPAAAFCFARKHGTAEALPVRGKKKPRRIEAYTVFILHSTAAQCPGAEQNLRAHGGGRRLALCRRAEKGLLAGFYEYPNVAGSMTAGEAAQVLADWGIPSAEIVKKTEAVHIFTHVEWHMTCYHFNCHTEGGDFIWADETQLALKFPLPAAFQKCYAPQIGS